MNRARMTRAPTAPGEILREEFLLPLEMSQKELADHIGQDVKVINRIVNGRSAVTAEVALKLAATFSTTPDFWLNAQPGGVMAREPQLRKRVERERASVTVSAPSGRVRVDARRRVAGPSTTRGGRRHAPPGGRVECAGGNGRPTRARRRPPCRARTTHP